MKLLEGWSFPINIDEKRGKIQSGADSKAIKQSVNMILKTQIMERKIFPDYGSELKSFMFEIVDSNYVHSFKKSIQTAIERCEPHVVNIDVQAKANRGPISKIEAVIDYTTDISPEIEQAFKSVDLDNE